MKEMTDEELLVFLRCQVENGKSLEEGLETARLVDDLLTLKKMHVLGSTMKQGRYKNGRLVKDHRLSDLLIERLDLYLSKE